MTKRQKKYLIRITVGAVCYLIAVLLPLEGLWRLPAFLIAYFILGYDVLLRAGKNIIGGQVFDENFLMSIATIGAFILGDYPEGVAVMLFYQVGEWFQSYAVGKSRQSIADLMDIRPDYANVYIDGQLERKDPEEVFVGDIIVIKPGEKIPMDCVITEGSSLVDTSALTGESVPREVYPGQEILSGCINQSGVLTARVKCEFGESTVAKILELVENAAEKKSKSEQFITKFARYYTPAVVIAAVLIAIVPPLFIQGATFDVWIRQALIFLVISCPCALVISVPLSFFGGIGGASKNGILVKGSNYLEALANAEIVVFDKTGTLTQGVFEVTEIRAEPGMEDQVLEWAVLAESFSDHPISKSLKNAWGRSVDTGRVSEAKELSGRGVQAVVDGKTILAGNHKLMAEMDISFEPTNTPGTVVYVSADGSYAGSIVISDKVKEDSALAIRSLKEKGIKKTVMLTGDRKQAAEQIGRQLGIDQIYSELLPADKVSKVEELLGQFSGKLVFVGDGINDAPVLSRADIGIAMGALGSDAAIEAADIVIMDDAPSKIVKAMEIAGKTLRIVRQNIVIALAVKFLVMALALFGMATMWEAVIADVGVSVIAILNAMRALRF